MFGAGTVAGSTVTDAPGLNSTTVPSGSIWRSGDDTTARLVSAGPVGAKVFPGQIQSMATTASTDAPARMLIRCPRRRRTQALISCSTRSAASAARAQSSGSTREVEAGVRGRGDEEGRRSMVRRIRSRDRGKTARSASRQARHDLRRFFPKVRVGRRHLFAKTL